MAGSYNCGSAYYPPAGLSDQYHGFGPDFEVDTFSPTAADMDTFGFRQLDNAMSGSAFNDPAGQIDPNALLSHESSLNDLNMHTPGLADYFAGDNTYPVPHVMPAINPSIADSFHGCFHEWVDFQLQENNTHAHSGPWNPSISRSSPFTATTSVSALHVSSWIGQPRHEFVQSAHSQTLSQPSIADSGYVSRPPPETASLASASSPTVFSPDDATVSDIAEPPAKRIRKEFKCELGADEDHKTRHFPNIQDLERHKRTMHGIQPTHSDPYHYRCPVEDCKVRTKPWVRRDNFRNHVVRRHFNNDPSNKRKIGELVEKAKCLLTPEEATECHENKQKAKQQSRRTAEKKQARRACRLASTEHSRPPSQAASLPAVADPIDAMDITYATNDQAQLEISMFGADDGHLTQGPMGSLGFRTVPQDINLFGMHTMTPGSGLW